MATPDNRKDPRTKTEPKRDKRLRDLKEDRRRTKRSDDKRKAEPQ